MTIRGSSQAELKIINVNDNWFSKKVHIQLAKYDKICYDHEMRSQEEQVLEGGQSNPIQDDASIKQWP